MNVSIAVDPQLRRLGHDSAAPAASQRRRGRLGRLMEHGPGALLVDRTVESAQNRQQTQTVFAAVQSHPDIRWWRHRLSLSLSLARAHTHTHTLSQNTGTVFLCLFFCFFFFSCRGKKKKKKKVLRAMANGNDRSSPVKTVSGGKSRLVEVRTPCPSGSASRH